MCLERFQFIAELLVKNAARFVDLHDGLSN
jgi:hypothetical protein